MVDLKSLKSMGLDELRSLSADIRTKILESVSKNGGHLASSLGAVELCLALHHVFDSPNDSIIWDVGHQAYAHKIVTGRDISKIRKKGGVCGFPKPSESEHDPLAAGHGGVSISHAAGIAKLKPNNRSIAVIGDGCMTSGVAYEAMNHAGSMKLANLIVVLNDNEMSISKNVGAIASFINSNIINTSYYQKIKSDVKSLLASFPLQKRFNIDLVEVVKKIRSSALNLIAPEAFFEAFGFYYVGPFDGHDLDVLIKAFRNIPVIDINDPRPILMHVVTKKGRGYSIAEESPCDYHGVSSFNAKTGESINITKLPSFTSVFGSKLTEIAAKNDKVMAITAAMKEGTGLQEFAERFPERFFDVGIAEQHAVSFAAGLAKAGAIPVVSIYSSFMQRSLDQIIHDIALNDLHVVLCLDRSGFVGEDGPTHHGVFDISYLRSIPGLKIMAPSNASELKTMLDESISKYKCPCVIRYPRGCVPDWEIPDDEMDEGKSRLIYKNPGKGKHISIMAAGYSSYIAKLAAEEFVRVHPLFPVKVYDARFIKPLDEETIITEAKSCIAMISVEENTLAGGFGSAILECISDKIGELKIPVHRLGISDKFFEHANQSEQRAESGIDTSAVYNTILEVHKRQLVVNSDYYGLEL